MGRVLLSLFTCELQGMLYQNPVSMYKDVHPYCPSCLTCTSYQSSRRRVRQPLMPIPVGGTFYCVGVGIMELPQTVNGNHYVNTIAMLNREISELVTG